MASEPAIARARAYGVLLPIVLVGATLSVLARDPGDRKQDSYPFSTFPMFATRSETTMRMSYARGETPTGRRFLSPAMLGTGEVLQARALIEQAVQRGPRELQALCTRVAATVARTREFADVTAISIVTGSHDAVQLLVHDVLGPERELTRCPVPRPIATRAPSGPS